VLLLWLLLVLVLQCLEQFGQLECWQQVMHRLHPSPKVGLSKGSIAGIAVAGAKL
jgi:hypothetical protein